jgi:hypothetical protein
MDPSLNLDIPRVLADLAATRPIFHSEADFQFSLAWYIQSLHPDAQIRLESRPEPGIHLDLLVSMDGRRYAIELKYFAASASLSVNSEHFALPNHGAQPLGRYDFCKDIWRVEKMVSDSYSDIGWAVALTNDDSYWRPGVHADPIDQAFRIHEGQVIRGDLAWHERTGGTSRTRKARLPLRGSYECRWQSYSQVERVGLSPIQFRFLAISVDKG